jgi:hypothetical protein
VNNRLQENAVMKYWLMAMCFSTLIVGAALAQQEKVVPLPPNAAAEAPKLEVAIKFRPNDLNDIDNATRQQFKVSWA